METLGIGVSIGRAKSAIAGTNTDLAKSKASSGPSYKAITQQIAYLMSAVAKQVMPELTKPSGRPGFKPNETNKYSSNTPQRSKCDQKNMTCWGVWELDIAGENVPLPDKGIPFFTGPTS